VDGRFAYHFVRKHESLRVKLETPQARKGKQRGEGRRRLALWAWLSMYTKIAPIVAIRFLASTVETLFTPDELAGMGVQLASLRD
jgi:hypothetical protein